MVLNFIPCILLNALKGAERKGNFDKNLLGSKKLYLKKINWNFVKQPFYIGKKPLDPFFPYRRDCLG
jgi:hypothetical protein